MQVTGKRDGFSQNTSQTMAILNGHPESSMVMLIRIKVSNDVLYFYLQSFNRKLGDGYCKDRW